MWIVLDDGLTATVLSDAAVQMHVRAACHCAAQGTRGLSIGTVESLGPRAAMDELVDRGLWMREPHGYRMRVQGDDDGD